MEKKYLLNVIDNAIKDGVPYIALKQKESEEKKAAIIIEPRDNFERIRKSIDGAYNDKLDWYGNSELRSVKIEDIAILKEIPKELKIFFRL